MNEEHEAGFTEYFGHRKSLVLASLYERFFQVNLATTPDETGHTLADNFFHDSVAVPIRTEHVRLDESIVLIV
jgi:hypothetical protein